MLRKTKKELGQFFTPSWIVSEILDRIGYTGEEVLKKKILEPSSGDGAFLLEIVERYVQAGLEVSWSHQQIKDGLETYICGVEVDEVAYLESKARLDATAERWGLTDVKWNLIHTNTLFSYEEWGSWDYIVGNPPYVKVHDLSEEERRRIKTEFSLCKTGTVNLYIAFFELGMKLLNANGKLGYITPNSFFYSISGKALRNEIQRKNLLSEVVSFAEFQVFDNISTYTAITILENGKTTDSFSCYVYTDGLVRFRCRLRGGRLSERWYFGSEEENEFLKRMLTGKAKVGEEYKVHHGAFTLRDSVFFSKNVVTLEDKSVYLFNGHCIEKELLRPAIKISKYIGEETGEYALFPYWEIDGQLTVIPEEVLRLSFPMGYDYLLSYKDDLLSRDIKGKTKWYEYGRSQGIKEVNQERLIIGALYKNEDTAEVKQYLVPPNVVVYAGMYASGEDLGRLSELLKTKAFKKYITAVGKDLRGGYKTLTPKIIKDVSMEAISAWEMSV